MNCPVCGADNRDGANFCRMCGEQIFERPQHADAVEGIDSFSEKDAVDATDVTAPDQVEAGAGDLSAAEQSEVAPEGLEELRDVADGCLEERTDGLVDDSALTREAMTDVETRQESTQGTEDVLVGVLSFGFNDVYSMPDIDLSKVYCYDSPGDDLRADDPPPPDLDVSLPVDVVQVS